MGLIEQAASRLEELKKVGVELPAREAETPSKPATRAAAHATAQPAEAGAGAARLRIDLDRLATAGYIVPGAARGRLSNEFRILKRTLIANATASHGGACASNLVMVTSSLPGEGKTFTALNLAMSIAMELDHTVLLVDGDVARPSLPALLGISTMPGLLDRLLEPRRSLESIVMRTNVEKLEFMSGGRAHAQATEMLSSEAMAALVREIGSSNPGRIVVFDSPPLLATTEAGVLARHMGQVLFVVAAGSTPAQDVRRALPAIDACPVKLLMLNKLVPSTRVGLGYGYDYGYEYGR